MVNIGVLSERKVEKSQLCHIHLLYTSDNKIKSALLHSCLYPLRFNAHLSVRNVGRNWAESGNNKHL